MSRLTYQSRGVRAGGGAIEIAGRTDQRESALYEAVGSEAPFSARAAGGGAENFRGPPLRILHALFSSQLAGSERYCADLANLQSNAGHEVHVAGTRGSPLARALSPGVIYHGFVSPLFRRIRLERLVAAVDADVCHGHLSAGCKALARVSKSRATVATLHVGYKEHQHAHLGGLICVNQAQSKRLGHYAGMARVIPNWIPKARGGLPTQALRQQLGLGEGTFVVGAIGRLHPSKGMDVLIKAFQAIAPRDAALIILGEGPQRRQLEQLRGSDHRIHLPGYRSDVHACLGSFDLFVSPSREESFGLAILEAMSSGLPVIATAAEGPAEFLRGFPVRLVPPGSGEILASALADARENFLIGALGRVAYDLRGFEAADRVTSIHEFYTQVIAAMRRVRLKRRSGALVAT